MKERPIAFSGPMVRAILAGAKTETRRPVKGHEFDDLIEPHPEFSGEWQPWRDGESLHTIECPYGQPGDLLWVKEAWAIADSTAGDSELGIAPGYPVDYALAYRASDEGDNLASAVWKEAPHTQRVLAADDRWRSSRFMPRWASRLTLRVLDVRVERLWEITEEGAVAEGAFWATNDDKQQSARVAAAEGRHEVGPRDYFREGWDTINGKRAPWSSNPWVWVPCFEKVAP